MAADYPGKQSYEKVSIQLASPFTQGQVDDMELGWRIAKEVSRMDIGQTVVVKNGVDTIHARSGTEGAISFQPTPAENVVDTTAAGDSFNAGLIAALSRGASLTDAIGQAAALSARVIAARGALVDDAVG